MKLKKLVALVLALAVSMAGPSELCLENVKADEHKEPVKTEKETDIADASDVSVDVIRTDDLSYDDNSVLDESGVYADSDEAGSRISFDSSTSYSSPYINSNGDTVWDCVWFGNYWQNDTNRDGTANKKDAKEPIKWMVLYASSDDLFLFSEKLLDRNSYNTTDIDITWEKSTIRSWLNSYNSSYNTCGTDYTGKGFINAAFSDSEIAEIKTTTVNNSTSQGYYDTFSGNDTYDKLYLLSHKEISNGSYGFSTEYRPYDWARRSKVTPFAMARGAWVTTCAEYEEWEIPDQYVGNGLWWLRSPGRTSDTATYVQTGGQTGDGYEISVTISDNSVRPALHISPSSSLISYAGTICSDGTVNELAPGKIEYYSVSFDSNGGSSVSSQTVVSGRRVTRPADPVKDGYKFAGWYRNSTLTSPWDFSTVMTSDMTLYAKWVVDGYTVTFNSNEGSSVVSQTVRAGDLVTKPSNPKSRYYAFAGWYKDSSLTTLWDFDNDVVASDITLYAKWIKISSLETNSVTMLKGQNIDLREEICLGKAYDSYLVKDDTVSYVSENTVGYISGNTFISQKSGIVSVFGLVKSGGVYVVDTDNKGVTITIKEAHVYTEKLTIKKKKKIDISDYMHVSLMSPVGFYSSKPEVASVDSYGTVTGIKAGKATITVQYTTDAGTVDFYFTVKVKNKKK